MRREGCWFTCGLLAADSGCGRKAVGYVYAVGDVKGSRPPRNPPALLPPLSVVRSRNL